MAGCGGTVAPTIGPTAAPTPTAPSAAATPRPTSGARLPASQQVVPPGTYTWDEFTPHLILVIAEPIWQVGHRHAEYFDLFPVGSDPLAGPGIGFGRFDSVHGPNGPVPMTDAAAVVAALERNPLVRVERLGPASFAGLTGLTVDLHVTAQQTPLLDGRGGTFHADPAWVTRYQFLDVDGGVLTVSVMGHDDRLAADLALAEEVLAGVRLAP
jgi:hypothetical protein